MEYLYFAVAGVLVGGVIAMRQQKRPVWVAMIFAVVAAVFLWLGLQVSTA